MAVQVAARAYAPMDGSHEDVHPVEMRMLQLLQRCGPQAALILGEAPPPAMRAGLSESVVDMTAREAGCGPTGEARQRLNDLVERGLVRLSMNALEPGRYLVLEDEHAGEPALRCSIAITRAGRRFVTAGGN